MKFDKVTYGRLFLILAEQAQVMSDGPLYVTQGEICPGCSIFMVVYSNPTSRQCDPPEREAQT